MNNWIDKASRRISKIAVPSLMKYIVITMGAVYVLDMIFQNLLSSLLVFNLPAIMSGQVWRVITFIFLPINSSPIFIIFALYFYYMIGEALESSWGYAKFNLFYIVGIIGTILAGLLTGFATNHFLNMSLFFAFAILYPEFEVRLFFILPIKVKWLAYVNAAYFLFQFIFSTWPQRIALLISVANIILFFHGDVIRRIKNNKRQREWRRQFKR
ncbi:MAG: hypothetical protein GX028_01085 [Clostridiaceae bacterium]|nr:hypothetical protein [Clostridiaceae bacterium]